MRAAEMVVAQISLDEAREEVWSRLFGSKCVKVTQQQWALIEAHRGNTRVPRDVQKTLQYARVQRDLLDAQLREAAKWLIRRGLCDLDNPEIDKAAFQRALAEAFGDDSQRPLSNSEIERLLGDYCRSTNSPTQDEAIETYLKDQAKGRKFDRALAREIYKNVSPKPVTRGRPPGK